MASVTLKKEYLLSSYETSEAIKTLRTNLRFSMPDLQTVCLTSCQSGDGKTTVAMNLAVSIAVDGKRVLYLDLDLRKSVVLNRVKIEGEIFGISHYLAGMADANSILCATNVPKLTMVFAGKRIANPTEMLGSKKMAAFLEAAKKTFDFVVIDAPPLGQVIDASLLCPCVDGMVVVVDAKNNSYRFVQRIRDQIEKSQGKVLGVVLNKSDSGSTAYGRYGRYGRYGKYGGKYY